MRTEGRAVVWSGGFGEPGGSFLLQECPVGSLAVLGRSLWGPGARVQLRHWPFLGRNLSRLTERLSLLLSRPGR